MIFWMEVIRTYSLMEALSRSPDISIFQRLFFDLIRMFIIPFMKMLAISNFNLNELLASLPKVCIIIAVLYSIPKENIEKYYSKNPYVRSALHMEFRYFKSINYMKFIAVLRKLNPNSMIYNFMMVNLIEGCSVVFVHWLEMYYNTGIPNFSNFWLNFKAYLILNVFSILYFNDALWVSEGSWWYSVFKSEYIYLSLCWTVLFITAWYSLQIAYAEETIFEKTTKMFNSINFKFFMKIGTPIIKTIRGIKNYVYRKEIKPSKQSLTSLK